MIPKYIFPPRPEVKSSPDLLPQYDREGAYLAQPKYNGSCCVVYLDGRTQFAWNRHREPMTDFKANLAPAYRGEGIMVITGEYLNKSQAGEFGCNLNGTFVIWDILALDGKLLVGSTCADRIGILERLYPSSRAEVTKDGGLIMFNHLLMTGMDGIYRAPTYTTNFQDIYNDLVQVPLYEGLVLKKKDSPLEYGFKSANNTGWQLKFRKPTKNYHF